MYTHPLRFNSLVLNIAIPLKLRGVGERRKVAKVNLHDAENTAIHLVLKIAIISSTHFPLLWVACCTGNDGECENDHIYNITLCTLSSFPLPE